MKKLFFVLLFIPTLSFSKSRYVDGEGLERTDRSAININFDKIDKSLSNAVTKTGDQTITGYKTFTSTVAFSTMTATLGTITTLTATTVSASSVTVTNFVTGGWLAAPYPMMIIQDQKAQNTAGGTFTSGAWKTRDLNTVTTTTISGSSLASNQITLPSGTYYARWSAPGQAVNSHQSRFISTPTATIISSGTVEVANDSATRSIGATIFTISSETDFELQHRCETTNAGDGYGIAANFTTEVYSTVEIWKLR